MEGGKQQQWIIKVSVERDSSFTQVIVFAVKVTKTDDKSVKADDVDIHFMEPIISIETFNEFLRHAELRGETNNGKESA